MGEFFVCQPAVMGLRHALEVLNIVNVHAPNHKPKHSNSKPWHLPLFELLVELW